MTSERSSADRRILCIRPRSRQGIDALERLVDLDWRVQIVRDAASAQRHLQATPCCCGLLILDEDDLPHLDAFGALLRDCATMEWVGALAPSVIASEAGRALIVEHLFDHCTLPVDGAHLASVVGHAWGRAQLRARDASARPGMLPGDGSVIGRSVAAHRLVEQIRRVARVDVPVLIGGESGSGKELAAQAIHRQSTRRDGAFIAVNCASIQPNLIQSELFGHEKGAFTGAVREGRGFIEMAHGGTLFLDEIGDLPRDLQANLLRFLQEGTICRVGSPRAIAVDARVIAATHVDLEEAVARGTFREDLYYRLNVVPLRVPPLRERREDVPLLAEHVFARHDAERGPQLRGFSRQAVQAMARHDWPGNVRELINRVRRALVLADGRFITPADLGLPEAEAPEPWEGLHLARGRAERDVIAATLHTHAFNMTQAARDLGVSRMTLYRLKAKHGIAAPEPTGGSA